MAYVTTYQLLNDELFRGRLQVGVYSLASSTVDNPLPAEDDPTYQRKALVREYAREVVFNPSAAVDRFIVPVSMAPDVVTAAESGGGYDQSLVTDQNINDAVIAEFNKIVDTKLASAQST